MREILFRGKRKANGVFAEGFLFIKEEDSETLTCIGIDPLRDYPDGELAQGCYFEIMPETVGQFTGLTDKNGKKIFEGDIVKVTDDNGETNFPDGGIGDVGFYDGLWYVSGEVNNGLNDLTKVYYVEVIGNIHDNPELMGVTDNA